VTAPRLSSARVAAAANAIDPVFLRSPQFRAEALEAAPGCELVVKVETVNPIRSFKGRGADWFVQSEVQPGARLVCASAGNFGQALAYACRRRGATLTVFTSLHANPFKIERMRALGAEVRMTGDDFDAAKDAARAHAGETGARMVEDGLEPAISEGAGTIALELLDWPEPLDAVVVPLGNGAMLGGMARVLADRAPATHVVAVCAEGAPAMAESFLHGAIVETARVETIADGIAVRVPIPEAVDDMRGVVDEVLLVPDEALVEAMRAAHAALGLVLEPAGAAGLAAIARHAERFAGERVATVLCGGNLTAAQVADWLA
jgi:threonine dehydratase